MSNFADSGFPVYVSWSTCFYRLLDYLVFQCMCVLDECYPKTRTTQLHVLLLQFTRSMFDK